MNKFNKKYNEILNSRLFYESIKTNTHNYKSIINVYTKTAKEFYNNIIIINDNTNNLILEEHIDLKFNRALINKIFQCNDFTQISANDIFNRCSNSIKSNYTIQKDIPVYIFKLKLFI